MLKRKFSKESVDAIGKKLVESDLLSVDEIDAILDRSDLFRKISRRIAEGEPMATSRRIGSRRWIPAAVGSFAALAIVAVFAFSVIDGNKIGTTAPAISSVKVPDAAPGSARPESPPKPVVPELSAGRVQISDNRARLENASYQRPSQRVSNMSPKPASYKPEAEFYPVAYTGDPAETASGGRIIRVDLKRSALFALGVNMPLENDAATVKADLLIGVDGVTRAVRLVE